MLHNLNCQATALVWKPHLFHSTGCIASPAHGRVWSTCHTVFVSLECMNKLHATFAGYCFINREAMTNALHKKYTRSMFPMILGERYENGMACRPDPSTVPVMQYIRCCGRGVVSRLATALGSYTYACLFTPHRACASKGLCDRSCPVIYLYIFVTTSSRIIGNYWLCR